MLQLATGLPKITILVAQQEFFNWLCKWNIKSFSSHLVYCLKNFWRPGQILTLLGDRASIKFYPCVLLLAIYPRPGLCYLWSSNAIKLLNYDIQIINILNADINNKEKWHFCALYSKSWYRLLSSQHVFLFVCKLVTLTMLYFTYIVTSLLSKLDIMCCNCKPNEICVNVIVLALCIPNKTLICIQISSHIFSGVLTSK